MRPLRYGFVPAILLMMTLFLSGCATVGTEEGAQFIVATSEAFSRFKGSMKIRLISNVTNRPPWRCFLLWG